jgi:hypothetical protein
MVSLVRKAEPCLSTFLLSGERSTYSKGQSMFTYGLRTAQPNQNTG